MEGVKQLQPGKNEASEGPRSIPRTLTRRLARGSNLPLADAHSFRRVGQALRAVSMASTALSSGRSSAAAESRCSISALAPRSQVHRPVAGNDAPGGPPSHDFARTLTGSTSHFRGQGASCGPSPGLGCPGATSAKPPSEAGGRRRPMVRLARLSPRREGLHMDGLAEADTARPRGVLRRDSLVPARSSLAGDGRPSCGARPNRLARRGVTPSQWTSKIWNASSAVADPTAGEASPLQRRASMPSPVHTDPEILGGTPVFANTRVPFQTLIDYLEDGQTLTEFLADFPTVTREQAVAALEEAKEAVLAHARPA